MVRLSTRVYGHQSPYGHIHGCNPPGRTNGSRLTSLPPFAESSGSVVLVVVFRSGLILLLFRQWLSRRWQGTSCLANWDQADDPADPFRLSEPAVCLLVEQ